jgi:hypothetical protein
MQNSTNLQEKVAPMSVSATSRKSIKGSVTLNTNRSDTLMKSSVNSFIFMKINPATMIRNTGSVEFRLKIKLSTASPLMSNKVLEVNS